MMFGFFKLANQGSHSGKAEIRIFWVVYFLLNQITDVIVEQEIEFYKNSVELLFKGLLIANSVV